MGVGAFPLRLPGPGPGLEKGRPSEQTKKIDRGMDMSMGMDMGMGINEDRPTVLLLHPDLDETSILD